MKKAAFLTLFFAILFSLSGFSQEEKKINWVSFNEAIELQKENPKKIFIDLYTDWCGWCKKMDKETFLEPEIIESMNKNYYAVKFDAESAEPIEFLGRVFTNPNPGMRRSTHRLTYALLGSDRASYPSFVILNETSGRMQLLKGYMPKERLNPILNYLGDDIYKTKNWEDYMGSLNETNEGI